MKNLFIFMDAAGRLIAVLQLEENPQAYRLLAGCKIFQKGS